MKPAGREDKNVEGNFFGKWIVYFAQQRFRETFLINKTERHKGLLDTLLQLVCG